MTALRATRAALVAVVLVLTVGTATAGAQTAPSLTTDAPQYLPGTTVTFTGTGYTGCTNINVNVFGPGGGTVATGITPVNGSFTGTFTAGTVLGPYNLTANSQQEGCTANVDFE